MMKALAEWILLPIERAEPTPLNVSKAEACSSPRVQHSPSQEIEKAKSNRGNNAIPNWNHFDYHLSGYSKFQLQGSHRLIDCDNWFVLELLHEVGSALGIFIFTTAWAEYLLALVLTSSINARTLPVGLEAFIGRYRSSWGTLMRDAFLPCFHVWFYLWYSVQGLLRGGLKF